ncbi:MAG: hypothetical protein R3C39_15045 [Dehalococcoidia bacterium]
MERQLRTELLEIAGTREPALRDEFDSFVRHVRELPAERRPSEEAVIDVLEAGGTSEPVVRRLASSYSKRIWGERVDWDDAAAQQMAGTDKARR